MDRTDIPLILIALIISFIFALGILCGAWVEENRSTQDAAVLMLKDPSGACEILRSGKCVIR